MAIMGCSALVVYLVVYLRPPQEHVQDLKPDGRHDEKVDRDLIHTCELCRANPFEYLTELQRHANELARNPAEWMHWNYYATLGRSCASADPS